MPWRPGDRGPGGPGRRDDAALDAPEDAPEDAPVDAAIDAVPIDAPPPLPSIQYLGEWHTAADLNTYTFPAIPLGAAALDRHVIVVAHGRSLQVPFGAATVQIGVAPTATRVVGANETMIGGTSSLHIAAVPDGRLSADITLRFTDGTGDRRAAVGVWVAYGLTSATPADTDAIQDGATLSQLTLDLPAGGVLVAGASLGSVPGTTTATWSGVGEAYDLLVEGTLFSGGATTSTVAQARTLTFDCPASFHRVVAATFR